MKYAYDEKIMEDPNAVQPQEAMQYYGEEYSDPGIASDMRKIGEMLGYEKNAFPRRRKSFLQSTRTVYLLRRLIKICSLR